MSAHILWAFKLTETKIVKISQNMARNTKALVMAVSMMFSNNLYECGPIEGYKFPVFTTASCPENKAEWLERSFGLNCTDQNGYMCIPNEMVTVLLEFCYTKKVEAIPEGLCLILNKRSSAVNAYRCQHFSYGCPSYPYLSNGIYEHQSCVSIMEGCFLADPYCERTVTANRKTTTSKYTSQKGMGTNSITTGTPFLTFWIIIVTMISSLITGYCLKLGIPKIIKRISKTSGGEASTGSASDPTTKQFKLDNIQVMPLEGPRAGGEKSSLNRNSNPGPRMDRASDQTTDLLIPDNIQDIPLEGPRAGLLRGSKESSLNQNSNPGPLTNHASVQTT